MNKLEQFVGPSFDQEEFPRNTCRPHDCHSIKTMASEVLPEIVEIDSKCVTGRLRPDGTRKRTVSDRWKSARHAVNISTLSKRIRKGPTKVI